MHVHAKSNKASYVDVRANKFSYAHAEKFPFVSVRDNGFYKITKRLLDFTGALLGLIFLSPVLILISLAVVIEKPGPVFFRQKRVGKGGKEFYMYKFRSMVTNAEELLDSLKEKNEADGPLFKIKGDPRITRTGSILRKTSLDELPQLINVLIGEMSLVGPRPGLPHEVEQYKPWQRQRLLVEQGMTGLWQVSGRSNLSFDEMIKLDLEYIENRSIWYDLKLILKTVPALLGSKGAY
ncbi:MAG: multidrug MFS transporter [Firmicutes bacterium HGW-Firmicutes-14]|jgi:exopolysaccharide biosynthesis polyprenyl glycosylphosphotransferase|nr:MAG: multidrug MFS transporter [Firmicutes bacterium HGW-Firmicutes-14]